MTRAIRSLLMLTVALLAEGVDRNSHRWGKSSENQVALLAEGVDRNPLALWGAPCGHCRPPRGGRG